MVVELHTSDVPSVQANHQTYEQRFSPPPPKLLRSLQQLPVVLDGGSAKLLRFAQWDKRLHVQPQDSEIIEIDVLGLGDKPEFTFSSTKADVCNSLLAGAEMYLDFIREGDVQVDRKCYHAELSATVTDIRRRLAHYQNHGVQEGYQPTIEDWQVEQFVRSCHRNEWLAEHVQQTNALKPFVRSLPDRNDDEFVRRCYNNLLTEEHALRRPTVEALAAHDTGDERARRQLLVALWGVVDYQDTVIKALAQVPDRQVIEDMISLLRDATDNPERREALLAALKLFKDVCLQNYLDESSLDSLHSTLMDLQADTVDPDLREAAQNCLATL